MHGLVIIETGHIDAWFKHEECRSDIYVCFNINFNVFFKLIKLHLLVRKLHVDGF